MSVTASRVGDFTGARGRLVVLRAKDPAHAAELVERAHQAKTRQQWTAAAPDRGWTFIVLGYAGPDGTIVDGSGVPRPGVVPAPGDLFVTPVKPVVIGQELTV